MYGWNIPSFSKFYAVYFGSLCIFLWKHIYIYQAIIPGIVAKLDLAVKKLKKPGKQTNNFLKVNAYLLIEASYTIRQAMGDILSKNFPSMIKPF